MQPEHSDNFPKTKTASLFALVVILNLAALFGVVFLFLLIRNMNEHAFTVNNDLVAAIAEKDAIQSLEKTVNAMQSDTQTLSSFLVTKDNVVDFLARIEDLGKATHCTTKVNTVEEVKNGQVSKIRLSVSISGSWTAMHTFLAALLNMPYKLDLKNVSFISSLGDDSEKTQRVWTGAFNFTVLESQ
ncbi:MAG: type 4a pilus biogenesis protein PilO [Candidatus Pacebacteria bacterium]|nr:type 4a pilus biogenesis protein PilO [Candidatus Paceibacterota bacterium]